MDELYKDVLEKYNKSRVTQKPLQTPGNIGLILGGGKSKYCLKLNTPKSLNKKSKGEFQDEIDFIALLNKAGVPVAKPVSMKNGEYIYSYKGFVGYAMGWLDLPLKLIPAEKDVTIIAKIVAKMHIIGGGFQPKYTRKSWSLKSTKYYLSTNKGVLPKDIYRELSSRFKEIGLSQELPKGFIHEDLGMRHFLWDGDKIEKILDFDRTYVGFLVCDLAQSVRGSCIEGHKKPNLKLIDVYLAAYNKARTLTGLEKKYFYNALRFAMLERASSHATIYAFTQKKNHLKNYHYYLGQDDQIIKIKSQVEDLLRKLP